ncbi:MAG: TIGR03435 family protein [Vicinamibacterales bacterium]
MIRWILAIVMLIVTPVVAQAPRLEVVSIRPADRAQFPPNIDEEDPCSSAQMQRKGRTVTGTATTLYSLIASAYNPWRHPAACTYATRWNLLSGGPDWVKSQRYAIQALLPDAVGVAETPNPLADANVQRMFQSMLAERFGLAVRQETRDRMVYFIELDETVTAMQRRMRQSLSAGHRASDPKYGPGIFSAYPTGPDGGRYVSIAFNRQSIAQLALRLATAAQGPVFDRTGLSGEFDFVLEYDETGVLRPTMVTAMREQLGLRLQPGRAPIDVLVVERAVPPSPN